MPVQQSVIKLLIVKALAGTFNKEKIMSFLRALWNEGSLTALPNTHNISPYHHNIGPDDRDRMDRRAATARHHTPAWLADSYYREKWVGSLSYCQL